MGMTPFGDLISASMGLKLAERRPDGTSMDDDNIAEYRRYRVNLQLKRCREENLKPEETEVYQDEVDQLERELPLPKANLDSTGKPIKMPSRLKRIRELHASHNAPNHGMCWEPTRWLMGAQGRSRRATHMAIMIGPPNYGITTAGLVLLYGHARTGMNVRYQMNYRSGWAGTWSGVPQNHPGGRLRDCMDAAVLVLDRLQLLAHETQETRDAVRMCIDSRLARPCLTVLALTGTVDTFADVLGIELFRETPDLMRHVAPGAARREP
jgi:hypothetical protein